jgi:hypothetical protein
MIDNLLCQKVNSNYMNLLRNEKSLKIDSPDIKYNNIKITTMKLLFDIIYNKTDKQFENFYNSYMSGIKLKQYYFTRLFNPFKESPFNTFDNVNDFINKCCVLDIQHINFYLELNEILKNIDNIVNTYHIINKEINKISNEIKKEAPKNTEPVREVSKKETVEIKKKKKPISATIKRLVWNSNIGEEIGKSKCMCCQVTDITQMSFNCGHIIAEYNGGETIVSNLKPICQNCNSSMGTKNMKDFIKTLK